MKKTILLGFIALFFSCKEKIETKKTEVENVKASTTKTIKEYPEALTKVFNAHGGLTIWKKQRTLTFDLLKPSGNETHITDLTSRRDKIIAPDFSLGFDGSKVWLLDESETYKGDPVFYHNLMFYFYAMPFVLADDGIQYGPTENLEFEGTSYPGIRISYDSGVGVSSKDEYYIHYHPETYQMAWLGYTVTYRSGESSDNVKWIRYDDWDKFSGILLPKSLTWHAYEDREIGKAKGKRIFENTLLEKEGRAIDFYKKPEKAFFVEKGGV